MKTSRARFEINPPDLNNIFACGLFLSIVALEATMSVYV